MDGVVTWRGTVAAAACGEVSLLVAEPGRSADELFFLRRRTHTKLPEQAKRATSPTERGLRRTG